MKILELSKTLIKKPFQLIIIRTRKVDTRMRRQDQNILLLVDNAPTYALYETTHLTNITIKHLLPNTTVHLQSCDQGIINSFKVRNVVDLNIIKHYYTLYFIYT